MPPQKRWHVRTSSFLSSQVVSNQVLSTYECLTTVFGMGTGGTTQLSPLDFFVEVAVNVSQSCGALRACILGTFSHTSRCPIACVLRTWLLDGSARRQTGGVAVLRRGFVDDERTAHLREDGWLNLSVLPQIKTTIRMPFWHLHCRLALLQILYKYVRFLAYI